MLGVLSKINPWSILCGHFGTFGDAEGRGRWKDVILFYIVPAAVGTLVWRSDRPFDIEKCAGVAVNVLAIFVPLAFSVLVELFGMMDRESVKSKPALKLLAMHLYWNVSYGIFAAMVSLWVLVTKDFLRVGKLREVERKHIRPRHFYEQPVVVRRMGEKMPRLRMCGLGEILTRLSAERRRLRECAPSGIPRIRETMPLLDGAPRRADAVEVPLRRNAACLREPVRELADKRTRVFLVAGSRIRLGEGAPEIHPVELPRPLGIERALLRRRVEEPVDPAVRKRMRDAYDGHLAFHGAVCLIKQAISMRGRFAAQRKQGDCGDY